MKIVIPKSQKKRILQHKVLWDADLPFKPRIERPKNVHQRRPKHRGCDRAWDI